MKYLRLVFFTFLTLCLSTSIALAQTPVQKHGNLRISGKHIVNKHGAVTSLAGPSFFWSNTGWGQERFYTRGAVNTFATDWKAGIVRVAVGAQNDGSILKDRRGNLARAQTVIEAAIDNGLYVIVDWHSHQAEQEPISPNVMAIPPILFTRFITNRSTRRIGAARSNLMLKR